MPLVEFYKPRKLSAKRLDRYLAGGWFRSSNGLFRNRFLCLDGQLCTVVNIRLPLANHAFKKTHRRLLSKAKSLRIEIGPIKLCAQMEELYRRTKHRFKGFVFPELSSFLYDSLDRKIFQSYHVKVYDNEVLVAASVFDIGEHGIMSVLGLYHPEYNHISPGILTMLLEVEWGKENGFLFYYPGYVLEESSAFNYKKSLGNYQYLSNSHRWISRYDEIVKQSPVKEIEEASKELALALHQAKIPHQRMLYKLFSLGYAYPEGTFLRHVIIFVLPELSSNPFKVSLVAYDAERGLFRLSHPWPVHDEFLAMNQSEEYQDPTIYYDMILQDSMDDDMYFEEADEACAEIQRMLHKKAQRNPMGEVFMGKPSS